MKAETEHFVTIVGAFNRDLGVWKQETRKAMQAGVFETPAGEGENYGDAKANLMLAYRHLEDAESRFARAIEAMGGGVSVYDKPEPTAIEREKP